MLTINIIGAGRLGKTIGKLITLNKVATIQGVCNQSLKSSMSACEFIGAGEPFSDISQLPSADITLITTADDNIKVAAIALSKSSELQEGSIVIHCSGSLTSLELESLKSKKCYIGSIHPMHSFANPDISVERFAETYCALEGESKAIDVIEPIFKQIGAVTYPINSDKKTQYHAAGVIASNYLVTLCEQAKQCLASSGVEDEMAMKVVTSLMQGTINNLSTNRSPTQSLTGPIKRGDVKTISKHMEALQSDKERLALYSLMGQLTLPLAELDHSKEQMLRSHLQNVS